VYRMIWLGAASALALAGCSARCDADVTLNDDSAHTASLVWTDSAEAGVSATYASLDDPADRPATVSSDGRQHTAALWGLPPLSEITYTFTANGETCEDTFTTEGMPSGMPTFTVDSYDPSQADGWRYIVGVAMGETGTLFVIDRAGRWRWHERHSPEINVSAVSVDGGTMLYNSFDQDRTNDIGQVNLQPLQGGEVTGVRTEGAHHTFAHRPDGTIAFPSVDVRAWTDPESGEEVDVVGDRILEVAPDGAVTELWNIWEHEEPSKHDAWDSGFYEELGQDWTHANALTYSEDRDSYLLSLGHLDTIYEIDRATGDVLGRWTPDDVVSGTAYNFQHDTNWSPDGTLLLLSYPDDGPAVAIEYDVNSDGGLEEVWSYTRDKSGTTLLGQVRRLPNGNTFINYGGIGEMREVTPDGDTVWRLNAGLGSWFGNVALLDTLPQLP